MLTGFKFSKFSTKCLKTRQRATKVSFLALLLTINLLNLSANH
jgi:hypothetical protein